MKHLARHLPHYFSLLGILVVGLAGFRFFAYDRFFQAAVAMAVAVSYVAWGIVHHKLHGDLDISIAIEYILVAALGLIVVLSLVFRA